MRKGFILALATGLVVCSSCSPTRRTNLKIEPSTFDFGSVEQYTFRDLRLRVTNEGYEPIEITGLERSCGCTRIESYGRRLEPGASASLEATISVKDRIGPFGATVHVYWKGVRSGISGSTNVYLRADAVSLLTATASWLDFGDLAADHRPLTRVIEISHGRSLIKWDDLSCATHHVKTVVRKKADGIYEVLVSLDPSNFPTGVLNDQLEITLLSRGSDISKLANAAEKIAIRSELRDSIPIKAKIVDDISAKPSSLFLGLVEVPGVRAGSFYIHSSRGNPIKILSIVSTLPDSLSAQITGHNSEGTTLTYRLALSGTGGPVTGKFLIKLLDLHQEKEIVVPLICYFKPLRQAM
jgi:hypothetical protein